jgi:hypothetical protein
MEYSDRIQALASFLLKNSLYDEYSYLCKFASDEPTDDDIVATTLVKEASVDGEDGMKAVHQVIMNRVANTKMTAKQIVLEKGDDDVHQFSCWNDISNIKAAVDSERDTVSYVENKVKVKNFDIALRIVSNGDGHSAVGSSTHYYTDDVPDWAVKPEDCTYNIQGNMATKDKEDLINYIAANPKSSQTADGKEILGCCRIGSPCWEEIVVVGSHVFGTDWSSSTYLPEGTDQCYKGCHNSAERGYGIRRWPRYRKK